MLTLPDDVKKILNTLNSEGHAAYVVGGCVRDSLMGIIPKDWDITTSALPHEIKTLFKPTIDTGIEHGTVTVVISRRNYEVTTFRIDGQYTDGRRPDTVKFTGKLEADLSRRDFTMNAIAYSPLTGITDPFCGAIDIKNKIIKCVNEPVLRFSEDALRMMRAIRFAAQLSFNIEEHTHKAIYQIAERLNLVSMERIRDELTKILCSDNPAMVKILADTGLWQYIIRGKNIKCNLNKAYLIVNCTKTPAMIYALLETDKAFMRHLKFDNQTINETALYCEWIGKDITNSRYRIKKVLNKMGPDKFKKLIALKIIAEPDNSAHFNNVLNLARDIIKSGECYTLNNLAVKGGDLIDTGIPPGKEIGRALGDLLDMVMAEPELNDRDVLLGLLSAKG